MGAIITDGRKKEEIHLAYELSNGIKVMITGKVKELLKKYDLKVEELWKIGSIGQCIEDIKCTGKCIQIMGPINKGNIVRVISDISLADDIWCICPEAGCIGAIFNLDPGIALKDPAIYISFKDLAKKISPDQRKPVLKMLKAMIEEEM
ncbi:unnamed protein product [marine sediment metagenome]|uniref:Uncharacterized protein n=1 Tax=marine sediment metagenome TaxID=412755 RepID=X1RZN5_9ZZZZ